ncbi:tripartite tricarboxylate transporter TctB family protein [Caproiciproducens sp. NJN-50]|uniref:tripartite tricarboxylate transporter TctB family protein n=1 Tax=Acutalibacteraceae TaxID=3082771 RepID=UPI000FFE1C6F|nr:MULTISPECIES: tripartite tricarboxylate transporter TctB family protein [Acutalibacteraceae]QAT48918.1 tripartite tricarboxylate transporter TctB family protein [Caproiciproducens sp. NJN-50]
MIEFYKYNFATSEMFFPKIIITLLIVLGICIVIPKVVRAVRAKQPLVAEGRHFFVENYDKLKLFGSIGLLIIYVFLLEQIHFIIASLLCIFGFNVLFCGTFKPKSLLISAASTIISVFGLWYLFGVLFNITLP